MFVSAFIIIKNIVTHVIINLVATVLAISIFMDVCFWFTSCYKCLLLLLFNLNLFPENSYNICLHLSSKGVLMSSGHSFWCSCVFLVYSLTFQLRGQLSLCFLLYKYWVFFFNMEKMAVRGCGNDHRYFDRYVIERHILKLDQSLQMRFFVQKNKNKVKTWTKLINRIFDSSAKIDLSKLFWIH